MYDIDHPGGLARFDLYVRHCPKCGWAGSIMEPFLRYCGPGQRLSTAPHPLAVVLGDGSECPEPGEHFHWECPACHCRRLFSVPDHLGAGRN